MSPTSKPSAITGLKRGLTVPQVRSDETIGRPEDIGTLTPERAPRPEKPIRFTLDLDRDRHRYLKEYALQIDAKASEIIRELLDEMHDNDDLRARVRARIWQGR
jgi:hypothetical protein